jgi:hypothetical protein
MKTVIGGPPGVRTALERQLEGLTQESKQLEQNVQRAETRDVDAEARSASKYKFVFRDLLPWNWGRLFQSPETYKSALDRLSKAKESDLQQARAELSKHSELTEPFRDLVSKLRQMPTGGTIDSLPDSAIEPIRQKHHESLSDVSAIQRALDAAGNEAVAKFPVAQLDAVKVALEDALEELNHKAAPDQHEEPVGKMKARRLAMQGRDAERNAEVAAPGKVVVADKQGPLKHLGQPVEFGAEKESNMKSIDAGDKLQYTSAPNYRPGLMQYTPEMLNEASRGKAADKIGWADLNDKGKSAYVLKFHAQTGKWPKLAVLPNSEYSKLSIEPNGWIEVISSKFDTIRDARGFLDKFGWGHIHTSWMRGAPPDVQKQQVAWMRNANLYMFLSALEGRGASGNGETFWRFAIKGLSIPTQDHLDLAAKMIGGLNMTATAFSKHLHMGMRASGKYGSPQRIAFEARGGNADEKKRVVDSLLNGLTQDRWGSAVDRHGEDDFELTHVGGNIEYQVKALPDDFRKLIAEHLSALPVNGLTAADASRLHNMVASATFYADKIPAARLNAFDQRACVPLLNYEAINWLSDGDRKRAIEARGWFIGALDELDKNRGNLAPHQLGQKVADLIEQWSKKAQLGEVFGKWLDGGERQKFISA